MTAEPTSLLSLLRPTQLRLVKILASSSSPVSGREFARRLEISPTSAIASLKRLERAGLVTRRRFGKAHLWSLNVSNKVMADWLAAFAAQRRHILLGLIKEHSWTKYGKVLLCARDVWEDIQRSSDQVPQRMPWEADLSFFTGVQVTVIDSYEPGRWKMIRHDHCEVIGGETPDQAMIVTHERCTILGESEAL